MEDKQIKADTFLETVCCCSNVTIVTRRMIARLIQCVEAYPTVKEDGVTSWQMTVHF